MYGGISLKIPSTILNTTRMKKGVPSAHKNDRNAKYKIKLFFAQEYFKSHIVLWLLLLSAIANIANWVVLKIFIIPVYFSIILHYNVYFGVDVRGSWKQVFILPGIGLMLWLMNAFLALYFYCCKERIAAYLLLIASLMIQLSLIVASISLILINY